MGSFIETYGSLVGIGLFVLSFSISIIINASKRYTNQKLMLLYMQLVEAKVLTGEDAMMSGIFDNEGAISVLKDFKDVFT